MNNISYAISRTWTPFDFWPCEISLPKQPCDRAGWNHSVPGILAKKQSVIISAYCRIFGRKP